MGRGRRIWREERVRPVECLSLGEMEAEEERGADGLMEEEGGAGEF